MINVFDRRRLAVCLFPLLAIGSTSVRDDRSLFELETFNGNGRTCLTCHSRETGTVSPLDAQRRFAINRQDPLFRHDGTDDGHGHGVQRILTEGTILVELPLPPNVSLADDPTARTVTVRRGIPSTLNTPALDPVLMWDGREPNLTIQARNAISGHAQSPNAISDADLEGIARFQLSDQFFSSAALRQYARGGPAPALPLGSTESEKRGRKFFEDIFDPQNLKLGSCAVCHSGPMLNRTNQFLPPPPIGGRFQSVGVSEFNEAKNPVRTFVFRNQDGSETKVSSPDPGKALITGRPQDANIFKISSLWGVRRTAPYFHDNSARTLEDVAAHYARLFEVLIPGNPIILTPQDQADIVAYLKLLE
jgi:cytochrome c peroxidase